MSVGCVRPYGDGAGGDGGEAGRAFEGDDGGARGCEGVEQGAPMTACEAEGSEEDEAMAGKENVSVQHAEGGSGSTSGIKRRSASAAGGRTGVSGRRWLGLTDDWRWMTRT